MANKPQPFGRYELLDRISAGGMAEVFRARDNKRGGQIVALKKILPQIAEDAEFIQMFEDEARIASQLEHPHIARTLDFGRVQPDGDYYIAFEYVDGKDMRAVFDRAVKLGEQPPLPFLIYVFARIGEGLSYAHARKDAQGNPVSIVHRDVSPQNIVVSYSGDVKLIDFGIAKAAGKLSRTQVGAIKGKFGYMSPEQVRGLEIDQRTDVFSLGICMWELLTRERLFAAQNELLVLEKIRNLVIPPPSSKNPEVGPELDRIVLKALAKDVGERYRYAKELYRDLNVFAQSTKAVATREGVAEYMRLAFPVPTGDATMSYKDGGAPTRAGDSTKWPQEEASSMRQVQETRTMADNKGSDLDIFEGLGKKSGGAAAPPPPPRSSAAPPPPPRGGPGGPPVNELGKKTLMGIASPAAPPPPSGNRPPAPPPPGRGSLPPVVPPPQKSAAPPPAPSTAPAPAAAKPAGGGMDMDWDDEDEATHIFDKDADGAPGVPGAPTTGPLRPAAGSPAFAPPPAPPPAMGRTMAMPPAQPTMRGLPPPTIDPAPPPPPPSRAPVNPNAMTLPIGNAPMQTQTEPLRMPPPPPPRGPSAGPPPPPPGGNYGMQQMQQPFPPPPGVPQGIPGPHPHAMHQQQQMGMGQTYPQQQQQQQQYQQPGAPQTMPPQNFAPNRMEATAVVRPPSSSKAPFIIVGLLLVFAIAAGGAFLFLVPRTGKIAVNVADSKGASVGDLKVFVDGKKVCDTAPCIVDQVSAGSHEVKVVADKFNPASKLVTVEARKDSQVDFALAGGGKGTGLKVAGPQPGVKLLVDGNEVGALPQELHDMTPGDHKLKFVGSERYAPLEQTVTLGKDEVKDLGNITLKVVKGKATITLGTPGAKVSMLSSTGDRRDLPSFPISVEIEPAKSSWTIEASKFGYQDLKQPISFDDGQAEKVFNISLDPKGSAAVSTGGGTTYVAPPHTATATANTGTTTSGGGETKFALITALPPGGSVCLLDNKPLGAVPKTDVSTSPGSHKIRCLNKDEGLDKTIDVTVGAGDAKKVVVKLRD